MLRLRIIDPASITDLESYRQVLGREELERIARFAFESDRRVRLVARASLRLMLAEVRGVPAQDLQFRYNEYGKPLVDGVYFNVSHTKDRIAIAVSTTHVVGVDIESVRLMRDLHAIAKRFFAEPEVEDLRNTAVPEERFFQYWTLKESYIKARGLGLSLPLDQFWFDLSGECPAIRFLSGIGDDPARWSFQQQRLDSGHYLAIASASAAE